MKTYIFVINVYFGVAKVVATWKILFGHNHDVVDVVAISNRGKVIFFIVSM